MKEQAAINSNGEHSSPESNCSPLLTEREVRRLYFPVSAVTLWRKTRSKDFPAPLRIGKRNFWWRPDVEDWLNAQRRACSAVVSQ